MPGGVLAGCYNFGLPNAGAADCARWCFTALEPSPQPSNQPTGLFHVSPSELDFASGVAYCTRVGLGIARIDSATELELAQAAIRAAGVEKAVSGAYSLGDGLGWAWFPSTTRWLEWEFPLNVGV